MIQSKTCKSQLNGALLAKKWNGTKNFAKRYTYVCDELNSLMLVMSTYICFSCVHSFVDDEDFKPGVSLDYVRLVGDQSALVSNIHIFSKLLCLLDFF